MKKTIITVLGKDKVGIIAKVCVYLSQNSINILDIAQTIVDGYFNMMMVVDVTNVAFDQICDGIAKVGEEVGVMIHCQREDIFDKMHRI